MKYVESAKDVQVGDYLLLITTTGVTLFYVWKAGKRLLHVLNHHGMTLMLNPKQSAMWKLDDVMQLPDLVRSKGVTEEDWHRIADRIVVMANDPKLFHYQQQKIGRRT